MRLKVALVVLLASAACVRSAPLSPTAGPWRFSGTVFGMNGRSLGAPLASAQLTIVDGVNLDAKVTTDSTGHYVFSGLQTGRFTMRIAAAGYVTGTPVVDIYKDTEANFALDPQ